MYPLCTVWWFSLSFKNCNSLLAFFAHVSHLSLRWILYVTKRWYKVRSHENHGLWCKLRVGSIAAASDDELLLCVEPLSRVRPFATPWAAARQAPLSSYRLELAQTHVYWVADAIQPSHAAVPFSSGPQSFPASGCFPMSRMMSWHSQSWDNSGIFGSTGELLGDGGGGWCETERIPKWNTDFVSFMVVVEHFLNLQCWQVMWAHATR